MFINIYLFFNYYFFWKLNEIYFQMGEPSCRIPKNFSPETYTITFSPDYSNLKYSMETEIIIISLSEKFPYLIINANEFNYKITYLRLYKFDNIADEWIEVGKINSESQEYSHLYYYYLSGEDKKYEVQDGLYIPFIKDVNKNRFPIFIDYNVIKINNEDGLDNNFLACHDKPFIYESTVKDGDIIEVEVSWLPFNSNSSYEVNQETDNFLGKMQKRFFK